MSLERWAIRMAIVSATGASLVAVAANALAKPIPLGAEGLATTRVRSEVAEIGEPSHHATEYLEIARSGSSYTFSWALEFPDGAVWSEVASGEVRDGAMMPLTVRRLERDGQGKTTLELVATGLDTPTVKLRVARNGGSPDEDVQSIDDPPLYPPVMTGTLYQGLFNPDAATLKFTTLADYPWGIGAAPMEALVDKEPQQVEVAMGSRSVRKVTLRPIMPWPLSTMVDAIGIDTAVFLWVESEPPHALQRFEGAYSYDSGRFRGDVVEQRDLADGEKSAMWPPRPTATAARAAEPGRPESVSP